MERMRFFRIVAMLFCVVLLFGLTAAPAYANSAQSHWTGIDSTGAIEVVTPLMNRAVPSLTADSSASA